MSSAGAIGYFNFKMINWVPRGREGKQCLKYLNTFRFKSVKVTLMSELTMPLEGQFKK